MTRHKQKCPKDPFLFIPCSEPLRSTRRDDGLWESVETDDNPAPISQPSIRGPAIEDDASILPAGELHRKKTKSVGIQTSPQPMPIETQPQASPRKPSELTPGRTNEELNLRAEVSQCILSHPDVMCVVNTAADATLSTDSTRRRRGRPRKSAGFRNRRSVRFSDPVSSEGETALASRDSHVFVRLLKVVVDIDQISEGPGTRQRQEFSWNNRGKGWRADGRRSDQGLVEIVNLFRLSPGTGVDLYPVVLPTETSGVRQAVNMVWDEGRACFMGMNQDGETLSVTLGEMKDMARDPWARQFVGYIIS